MADNGLPPLVSILDESPNPGSNLDSVLANLNDLDPLSAIWQLIPLMDQLDQQCGLQRKIKQFATLRNYVHQVFNKLMLKHPAGLETRALATCYKCLQKLVILEMALIKLLVNDTKNLTSLARLLHNSITDMIAIKVLQYQHYQKVRSGQWVQLNKLFMIAEKFRVSDFACEEETFFSHNKTRIQDLYAVTMLMSCSRLNQLTVTEIKDVMGVLFRWANLIQLNTKSSSSGKAFLIDVSSGDSPGFQQLMSEQDIKLPCYIYVDKLLDRLDGLLQVEAELSAEDAKKLPSHDLLEHLRSAWGQCVTRQPRVDVDETLSVYAGFENVLSVLQECLPIKNKERLSVLYEDDEDVATIEQQRAGDIWSSFIFNEENVDSETLPSSFDLLMKLENGYEISGQGSQFVQCTNRSLGGCCLVWNSKDLNLKIGQLLLMKDSHLVSLGVIAWVNRNDSGKWETGVRMLSKNFAPLLLDPPMGSRNRKAREAIFLPADGKLLKRHMMVLVGDDYREGSTIQGSFQDEDFQWYLQTRLKSEPEVSIYECGFCIAET